MSDGTSPERVAEVVAQLREEVVRLQTDVRTYQDIVRDMTAELARLRADQEAVVGAVLEEAADACADYPRTSPDYDEWTRYDEQLEYSQQVIRALRPSAATALARAQRAARNAGIEAAAAVAEVRHEMWNDDSGVECDVTACRNIASAIRSLIEPEDQP